MPRYSTRKQYGTLDQIFYSLVTIIANNLSSVHRGLILTLELFPQALCRWRSE